MKKKSIFAFRIFCALWLIVSSVFVSAQETNTLTDSVCHCRLLTNLYYGSSYGGSVDIYVGEDASGMFFDTLLLHVDFNHYGITNYFVDLPLYRWIRIDYKGLKEVYEYVSGPETVVKGVFVLYDENDSILCSGPEDFEGNISLWNACSLGIPDSVSDLSVNHQGNTVNLSWTNPAQTVTGNPLAAISRIEIRRNEQLIHTFTSVIAGEQMNYTDILPSEGTYQYTIQCFNEEGDGIPAAKHFLYGSNLTLFDYSHNVEYTDSTCFFSISNDNYYTRKGHVVLSFHRGDSTKMWSISGNATLDSNVIVKILAGEEENLLTVEPDSSGLLISHDKVTFIFDIPAGSSPQFYYTVECVNSVYEQPDTTIAIIPDSNGIIYVTQNGAGLRNGSSWVNATPWLNKALTTADAMSEKPMIWVAKGTYYGTPQMTDDDDSGYAFNVEYAFLGRSGVNVYGGFAGNEPADYDLNLRNYEQNETVLDGMLHHTVVNVGASEWNGFHIQRGTNGCGMKESSIIRHCVISDCANNGITRTQYEVGIIDSCSIINNGGHGIAVGLTNRISNSLISRNAGDGIRSGGTVLNCEITQNGGGGFVATSWMGFSRIGVVNCLIANNGGDGMLLESNNYKVTNATIVNNGGIGVKLRGGGHEVRNSIVYGNAGVSIDYPGYVNISNFVLDNCAVEGSYLLSSHNVIPLAPPSDTLGFHPGFVSPTAGTGNAYSGGDWHLSPNSVCVNRGVTYSDYFPETDIEGNPRILQNVPDIGVYESPYSLQYEDGKIIYVKADGEGDGSSWSNATADLNHAIESAWGFGPDTRIWVAEGTYLTQGHPFYIKENLRLMGGFVGNEPANYDVNLRNTLAHPSILDGQNQNRVLLQMFDFEGAGNALVDGFTLAHGLAGNGAGASLMANTTLSKCRVVNNVVTNEGDAVVIAVRDTLKQLLVQNNEGSGVQAESSQLLYCTVVRNNGDGVQVSGNTMQDSSMLYNSIVWGNALLNLHFTSAMAKQNTPILHCAIENQIVDGEDNIVLSSDSGGEFGPHFINPTDSVGVVSNLGDWHLDSSSVCVNAGAELSDLYGIHTDLAGQPRIQNEKADIGAMESPYNSEVLCRNMEVSIYEGDSYLFYGNTMTTAGWYEHRWNVGAADSLVVLHLITKHVMFVSETGAGNMDGSSWANALDGQTATTNGSTKLADALQTAIGTEFWIQSGTYQACSDLDVNKSLMLNSGVALYGGFTGIETAISQRDPNNAPTVFSGNLQNDTVVEHYSRNIFKTNEQNDPANPIVLDNITVTKGFNDNHSGTALHIYPSSTLYANRCRFHHHVGSAIANEGLFKGQYCSLDSNVSNCVRGLSYEQYYDYQDYYEGAAAFTNKISGVASFNHCAITYNQAPYDGAIFNSGEMAIDSSEVSYNKATENFIGAIYNTGNLIILNTTLSYNQSYKFFSTVASFGSLIMRNCHVSENQSHLQNPTFYWYQEIWLAAYKSAHIMSDGVAEVSNCVFTHNSQNSGTDGGCLHISGKANIRHCDFINNIGSGYSHSFYGFWGDGSHQSSSMIIITFQTSDNDGGGIHVENGDVYAENCLFDQQTGMSGTSASVRAGRLTLNACVFTRNLTDASDDNSILTNRGGELIVNNSLFANNQNPIFNTTLTVNSTSLFTNCTFVNNESALCHFRHPRTPSGCDPTWIDTDTAHVNFRNCIIVGDWGYGGTGISDCGDMYVYYPNYTVNFTNTMFDTLHAVTQVDGKNAPDLVGTSAKTINVQMDAPYGLQTLTKADVQQLVANQPEGNLVLRYDAEMQDFVGYSTTVMSERKGPVGEKSSAKDGNTSDCTPDSFGNFYYCDPMFVNPTTVVGVDSVQDPLLYDFRLQASSPAINSGDTTGLHLTADATDLDGEHRIKQCLIDRGCYEYGTVVYDTILETVCVEPASLNQYAYTGHGFTLAQLKVGENIFTRNCDCHTDANDTVLTLQLFVSLIQQTEDEAIACDSLHWHDEIFRASGDYTRTFTNGMGCDSVVTMHLTVKTSSLSEFSDTVCGSYTWNDVTYTESGDYTQTLTNAAGCDSVVTLHLTVHHEVDTVIYDYFCNGSTYPFFGQNLSFAGTYTHTGQTEYGCDSTITLHLEMKQIYYAYQNAHLCDGEGYDFFGETLYTAGTYTQILPSVYGCDSTIYLALTTGNTTYGQLEASICEGDSYNFHGQTLTTEGIYIDTITNSSGCDSILTLHLTINQPASSTSSATICDSELPYVWNGVTFNEAGTQSLTLQTVNGCDSVVEMTLSVNPSVTVEASLTINESDLPFTYGDTTFMPGTVQSGDYIFYFTTTDGCDSIIILHLTVETGISSYDLNASMNVYPNPTTDIINVQLTMNYEQLNNVEIQVYDIYGKLLDVVETRCTTSLQQTEPIQTASPDASNMSNTPGSSSQTTQIDLSRYANGVYFIKAVSDGNVLAVRKVVKNK